jgi:hypothetical protein
MGRARTAASAHQLVEAHADFHPREMRADTTVRPCAEREVAIRRAPQVDLVRPVEFAGSRLAATVEMLTMSPALIDMSFSTVSLDARRHVDTRDQYRMNSSVASG